MDLPVPKRTAPRRPPTVNEISSALDQEAGRIDSALEAPSPTTPEDDGLEGYDVGAKGFITGLVEGGTGLGTGEPIDGVPRGGPSLIAPPTPHAPAPAGSRFFQHWRAAGEVVAGIAQVAAGGFVAGTGLGIGIAAGWTGVGAVVGAGVATAGFALAGKGFHGAASAFDTAQTRGSGPSAGKKSQRPPPSKENYRGRYNAAQAAKGRERLPKKWDAHHRIPQEYRDHPDFKDFDFDAPENIRGVKGSRSDVNIHQNITNDWADFRKTYPNATREQIEEFAEVIDILYEQHWWNR